MDGQHRKPLEVQRNDQRVQEDLGVFGLVDGASFIELAIVSQSQCFQLATFAGEIEAEVSVPGVDTQIAQVGPLAIARCCSCCRRPDSTPVLLQQFAANVDGNSFQGVHIVGEESFTTAVAGLAILIIGRIFAVFAGNMHNEVGAELFWAGGVQDEEIPAGVQLDFEKFEQCTANNLDELLHQLWSDHTRVEFPLELQVEIEATGSRLQDELVKVATVRGTAFSVPQIEVPQCGRDEPAAPRLEIGVLERNDAVVFFVGS